jgi:ABC-type transporter Mla subunit MlaD
MSIRQSDLGEELLKQVGKQISDAMSGAAGEEMRSMRDALQAMVHILRDAAQVMKDNQGQLAMVASGIIDRMDKSFGENSEKMRHETDQAVQRVAERLEEAATGLSSVIQGAGQTVAAGITEASNAASDQLVHSSAQLQGVIEQCRRILVGSEAVVERFGSVVVTVSGLMQEIATAHEALRCTATPLQTTADRVAYVAGAIGNQVQLIASAAESLQATSAQLNEMQASLSSTWDGYERRFRDVDEALASSLQQIVDNVNLYAEKIREMNSGLDTQFSKALGGLSGAILELQGGVEDLQTVMSSVPRRSV